LSKTRPLLKTELDSGVKTTQVYVEENAVDTMLYLNTPPKHVEMLRICCRACYITNPHQIRAAEF